MEGGGEGVQKAPKTQNMTGYQKFRSHHPLATNPLLPMYFAQPWGPRCPQHCHAIVQLPNHLEWQRLSDRQHKLHDTCASYPLL